MSETVAGPVAAALAEIRERHALATPGPWWSDQDERCYRLHGVAFRIPAQAGGVIPEQVMNKQIAKAPKQGTPYAEYWPDAADDTFITHAWEDMQRLLAALEAALALHVPVNRGRVMYCCRGCEEVNGDFHEDCCHEWPCPTYDAIAAGLLAGRAQAGGR